MSVFERHPVHDFLEWLVIATKVLATPAPKRIALEIEAH